MIQFCPQCSELTLEACAWFFLNRYTVLYDANKQKRKQKNLCRHLLKENSITLNKATEQTQ